VELALLVEGRSTQDPNSQQQRARSGQIGSTHQSRPGTAERSVQFPGNVGRSVVDLACVVVGGPSLGSMFPTCLDRTASVLASFTATRDLLERHRRRVPSTALVGGERRSSYTTALDAALSSWWLTQPCPGTHAQVRAEPRRERNGLGICWLRLPLIACIIFTHRHRLRNRPVPSYCKQPKFKPERSPPAR
jgi:hypothetical protein